MRCRPWLFALCAVLLLTCIPLCTANSGAEGGGEEHNNHEENESQIRYGMVLLLLMLFASFMMAYWLETRNFHYLHHAGAAIFMGMFVGVLLEYGGSSSTVKELAKFDGEFFMILLLPPIIFESGYNMKRRNFFKNIDAISAYAFGGTLISTFVVGLLTYWVGKLHLEFPLSLLESLVFGALISATDPVTVLAIFQSMHADVNLFSLVFGESVLNDAVAIVLYTTLIKFKDEPFTVGSVFLAIIDFFKIFVGSFFIGALFAVLSAVVFKKLSHLRREEHFQFLEISMLTIVPYIAYYMAEGMHLSGIVTILFCGVVMAHYTYNNLSRTNQQISRKLFKIFATLSESFVFLYLGLAFFMFPQEWEHVRLIFFTILIVLVARTFNIFPMSYLVNRRRPESRKISKRFQFVMWFSGLRGAIAFVLALKANEDLENGGAILTTTLFVVLFTVIAMGGSTTTVLEKMDVRERDTGLETDAYDDSGLLRRGDGRADKFLSIDRKYIKPFLTVIHLDPTIERRDLGPSGTEMHRLQHENGDGEDDDAVFVDEAGGVEASRSPQSPSRSSSDKPEVVYQKGGEPFTIDTPKNPYTKAGASGV